MFYFREENKFWKNMQPQLGNSTAMRSNKSSQNSNWFVLPKAVSICRSSRQDGIGVGIDRNYRCLKSTNSNNIQMSLSCF